MKAEYLVTIGATSSQVESTSREVAELKRIVGEMQREINDREMWFHMPGTHAKGADETRKPGISVQVINSEEEENELRKSGIIK